ncbi:hypothetical protein VNO77_03343 [Canavalia gladiata]|uniref:Uncharacterized protein n=1 Tax=Canavalia gladiata TaxID=3824 RepID=A0AAN9RC54_CANGL
MLLTVLDHEVVASPKFCDLKQQQEVIIGLLPGLNQSQRGKGSRSGIVPARLPISTLEPHEPVPARDPYLYTYFAEQLKLMNYRFSPDLVPNELSRNPQYTTASFPFLDPFYHVWYRQNQGTMDVISILEHVLIGSGQKGVTQMVASL